MCRAACPAGADIDGHSVGAIGDCAGKATLVVARRHGHGQARWYAELVGHGGSQGTGHGTRFVPVGEIATGLGRDRR